MEYYNKAKMLLDKDAVEFTGGVTIDKIRKAEESLKIKFSESYKAFLLDFGAGDIGGEAIFGIVKDKRKDLDIDMVRITHMEHKYKMPKYMVVIFYNFSEDSLYCLDTSKMYKNECPIVSVSNDYTNIKIVADSFGEFFYQMLADRE